jgi:putative ABC transport system permease protein
VSRPKTAPDAPPRLASWLMVTFFRRERDRVVSSLEEHELYSDSVAGDLEEVYFSLSETQGIAHARRWYWAEVIKAVLPSFNYRIGVMATMFASYLKTALRHLWRTRWYTAINIGGLGIALAMGTIALLYARNELSYDRFHPDQEQLYRAGMSIYFGELDVWESTPFPLADALVRDVSGIEAAARLTLLRARGVLAGDQRIEAGVHMVSPDFLSMFDFPLRYGTPELIDGSVILSTEEADRLFGETSVIGQTLQIELRNGEWTTFEVGGVARTIPLNSSIQFDYLISDRYYDAAFGPGSAVEWQPKSATASFVKLAKGADVEAVARAADAVGRANNVDQFLEGQEVAHVIPLQRLNEAHFSTLITNRILSPNGNPLSVMVIAAMALLLLAIACVNFVNLALGLSARRTLEVGVRKVFGADRGQLIRQYTLEAIVVAFLALVVGLGLAALLLPTFNATMGQHLSPALLTDYRVLLSLVGIALVVGLVAGSYPSFYLSRFRPADVLKSSLQFGGRSLVGKGMIGFQFGVSIFLISATVIMSQQLSHLTNINLGYNKEHVILQDLSRGLSQQSLDLYRESLLADPNIERVSGARAQMFGDGIDSALLVELDGESYTLPASKIDPDFLDVMQLRLASGRNLSLDRPTDADRAVLVNEAFLRVFDVEVDDETPFATTREGAPIIVGVVSDFHFQSLRNTVDPMLMYLRPESDFRQVLVRVTGHDLPATLDRMEARWNNVGNGTPFTYRFLDDAVSSQYVADSQNRRVGSIAALIALVIAVAGLLGMTSLSVARRTKEIGVRKVLGASGARVVLLFNAEYAIILLVSSLVATPAAYYLMNLWLEQFAYRIQVQLAIPIGASLLVGLFAVATITSKSLSAAVRNPVDSIRYE